MYRPLLFTFYFLISTPFLFAQQSKIDSLRNELNKSKEDIQKVNLLQSLSFRYKTVNPDSSIYFSKEALTLTEKLISQSDNKEDSSLKISLGNSYYYLGVAYNIKTDYETAKKFYLKALSVFEQLHSQSRIANAYNNLGNISFEIGKFDEAITHYLHALKIREELGEKNTIATTLNNLGLAYEKINDLKKSTDYYQQSLKIREKLGDELEIALSLNNVGYAFINENNSDKALEYFLKAKEINTRLNDKQGLASTLGNMGIAYQSKNDFSKAIEYYLQAQKVFEELGDDYQNAMSFNFIGGLYAETNDYNKAILNLKKGLAIATAISSKDLIKQSYEGLTGTYAKIKDFKHAYEYHQLFSQIKDSMFNEESSKQIAEMQTKYETEKKEQQIKLLNKDKEIQSRDLERQKTIRNAVAGGLILVLLFSFVLINRLLLIRKQKKIIEVEREKSEKLLLNILPKETADELKLKNAVTPKRYDQVTVMFTDFKGFTTIAEKMTAEELVSELDFIFKKFDEIISKYPIEKIKTIGDAYMCAGGLPVANTTNPMDVVMAALEIQEWMKSQNKWQLRLGIHTGSVIAGVVGNKKFAYDIWGDTVNTASRMESSGEPNKVNISGSTYELIKDKLQTTNYQLQTTFRGKIPAKNKGEIEMYFVEKSF